VSEKENPNDAIDARHHFDGMVFTFTTA